MKLIKKFRKLLFIFVAIVLFILISQQALAQDSILPACVESGNCTLCDIIQTAINAAKVILGIIGSLVLFMFIYGGFMMLTSAGKSEQINKGKNILINSVIGLAIIFSSYLVVITVVSVITNQEWNMATIQGKLTCVPLSFEPQDLSGYANLSAYINQPSEGGALGENAACTKSSACQSGMFCNASKKCEKKLATDVKCLGKTIESTEMAQSAGVQLSALAFGLAGEATKYIAYATKDNAACLSGDCEFAVTKLSFVCTKSEEGSGNVPAGGTCEISNDCQGGYCNTQTDPHKCADYKKLGQSCINLGDDDDAVCGPPGAHIAICDNHTSLHTESNKCIPYEGRGNAGEFCTASKQCKSPLVCIGGAYNAVTGTCKTKLTTGDTCDQLSMTGDDDDDLCDKGECNESENKCL